MKRINIIFNEKKTLISVLDNPQSGYLMVPVHSEYKSMGHQEGGDF